MVTSIGQTKTQAVRQEPPEPYLECVCPCHGHKLTFDRVDSIVRCQKRSAAYRLEGLNRRDDPGDDKGPLVVISLLIVEPLYRAGRYVHADPLRKTTRRKVVTP